MDSASRADDDRSGVTTIYTGTQPYCENYDELLAEVDDFLVKDDGNPEGVEDDGKSDGTASYGTSSECTRPLCIHSSQLLFHFSSVPDQVDNEHGDGVGGLGPAEHTEDSLLNTPSAKQLPVPLGSTVTPQPFPTPIESAETPYQRGKGRLQCKGGIKKRRTLFTPRVRQMGSTSDTETSVSHSPKLLTRARTL